MLTINKLFIKLEKCGVISENHATFKVVQAVYLPTSIDELTTVLLDIMYKFLRDSRRENLDLT